MPRLPFLLLPLVLLANAAGGQTLQEKRHGPAAPGDTIPKVVSREFELYGPTGEEVRKANDEIKVAISQFGEHLGEQPKKMAFVLFRSAEEAGRYDPKPLTRRGMQIVPWILPAGPKPPPGSGARPEPLAHEAGHRFLVAYVEHALAEVAAQGFGASETGSATGATAGATAGAASGGGAAASHPDVPILPDWLEEGIAALCERPSLQKNRMDFMRAHLDRRIPFAELLAMQRPAGPAGAKGAKPPGGTKAPPKGAAKGTGGSSAADAERSVIFIDEALSLARFIAQREDDRFVGTIVEGVLRGRTVGDILNTSQNILSKPEALEKQWLEWMQGAERAP
jgi:hypothetical protein